ncbi:DNA/RNA non-specific endonuclease [Blastococcus sp. PRF04-17]|uniref:DNA/RNA non-specific endonuclease n=1 Tax=Blastococcus sp. PRF04-17 TaxID=2933797 RepID=UPI001FF341DF|nr:DNA/RNA non-specific endonuclease [Blastococcus sp. PRF04-17]UOY00193.1 DNA/RNA non-specific endonuclease [Blastococcus sp. PRF04-17]
MELSARVGVVPAGVRVDPATDPHAQVFISYAREDEAVAQRLRELLHGEGWDVWWDRDLYVGTTWEQHLLQVLEGCRAVVLVWSAAAAASDWVGREMAAAAGAEKLLPCVLDATPVPPPYDALQFAPLQGWTGDRGHPALPGLFAGLERHVLPSRIETVRPGFDTACLGPEIDLPGIPGVGDELPYLHFSVVMNPARRLAWYVASEVRPQKTPPERPVSWSPDPTLSRLFQPANQHFTGTGFDRGHLAAAASVGWGEPRQAEIAVRQAFYWTNMAPQAANVNRSTWLALEQLERRLAERHGAVAVFGGPVLDPQDPLHVVTNETRGRIRARQTFRLPRAFWKVLVWSAGGGLRSACFDLPNVDAPALPVRRPVDEIEAVTGLDFPPEVRDAVPADAAELRT